MTAHKVYADGRKWIRVVPASGRAWDEETAGWEEVVNLTDGTTYYRHPPSGRLLPETQGATP